MRAFLILFLATSALAQTNIPGLRTWTFKAGGKFDGAISDFKGTNQVVMIGVDKRPYSLPVASLIDADQERVSDARADAELARQTKKLNDGGWLELTVKFIENYPEKAEGKSAWMDAEFYGLSTLYVRYPSLELGFSVLDRERKSYSGCFTLKGADAEGQILKLKRGDKIRMLGTVQTTGNYQSPRLLVASVQVIKPAPIK